jgi:broad specificity phosphatase PhoE
MPQNTMRHVSLIHDYFQQRILVAWQALLEAQQGKRILLITHSGVIRIILAHSIGLDVQHSFRLKIGHACLSRLEYFHSPGKESFCDIISNHFRKSL